MVASLPAQEIDGNRFYYTFNAHGDVIQRIRENGDAAPRYDYDAFGNQQTVNTDPNPFRYCGEYWDDETNLIYLRARYYDSKTGRFISQDSVHSTTNSMPNETEATDPLSLNLYNYCHNNPTKYIDSSGNGPILALFGAAGILLLLALAGGATVNSASSAAASGADPIKDIQQLVDNAAQAVQTVYMLPTYIVAYFASKSITNPASAVAPTTPGYAAVSQAPSVTVQEQATFSYPAYKSYDKPDNGDKTEVKAEDLVGAISTPASPPPPDPNKNNSDESNYDFGKLGKLVKHPGTKIDWSKVTTHAVEQMAKRGITRNMVETWVKTGQALQQVGGKYLFVSKDGAAVVNQAGKVITAYSRATYDANMWRVVKILFGI